MHRRQARNQAEELLVEVGLKERMWHKPGELSGGEQQRVAVARALVLHPTLLLADEPTGNLDSETGERIIKLVFSLNRAKGVTLIVVTHNDALARRFPRRISLVDGQVA
jgi:lipoprotein-releasing system ATP-binding protein